MDEEKEEDDAEEEEEQREEEDLRNGTLLDGLSRLTGTSELKGKNEPASLEGARWGMGFGGLETDGVELLASSWEWI